MTLDDRKRFKCRECQKGFTELYNLKAHMKKHTVDKAKNKSEKRQSRLA